MTAYYNEIDPYAAQWLRNLIAAGLIAKGEVDERDIRDIRPSELRGYTQCHFFAGIGGWSLALRLAGWRDDRPVWTGSCPCQPFSAAGQRAGFIDERHLWPYWFHLIGVCDPAIIFGEQVANKSAEPWLDLVQDDLEALGYAFGAVPLPAASVGAPHIRDRLWFVADAARAESSQRDGKPHGRAQANAERLRDVGKLAESDGERSGVNAKALQARQLELGRAVHAGELANSSGPRLEVVGEQPAREERETPERSGATRKLGNASRARGGWNTGAISSAQGEVERGVRGVVDESELAGATRGFWHPADWLPCRDGKARPVEPGTFPLAHRIPARVGRLRAYGNAIVPQVAAEFIRATGVA